MKKLIMLGAAIVFASLMPAVNADLVITDPGFESGSLTDVGDPFDELDSANFDKWVFKDDTGSIPREWSISSTGGNPDKYADGTFGNSTGYRRTIFQAVTDDKANTGLMDLTFDLNLLNGDGGSQSVVVGVWGVTTLSGATFHFDTAPGPNFGSDSEDAVSLVSQTFTTDTTGWQKQTISNIDLGTGYDLVIIGFQSNNFSASSTAGIDNVAMIPEPATMGMISVAGLALMLWRRRMRK